MLFELTHSSDHLLLVSSRGPEPTRIAMVAIPWISRRPGPPWIHKAPWWRG